MCSLTSTTGPVRTSCHGVNTVTQIESPAWPRGFASQKNDGTVTKHTFAPVSVERLYSRQIARVSQGMLQVPMQHE